MFGFIMELVDLACAEIEIGLDEVQEVIVEHGLSVWSVLVPSRSQEAFFMERDGKPFVYHVNCYD